MHGIKERPPGPDLRGVPGPDTKERILNSPFIEAIKDAGPEAVTPKELNEFANKLDLTIRAIQSQGPEGPARAEKLLSILCDPIDGASLGKQFNDALNDLGAKMKPLATGAAEWQMGKVAARDERMAKQIGRLGNVLGGLEMHETTEFMDAVIADPKMDVFSFVAGLQARRAEVGTGTDEATKVA